MIMHLPQAGKGDFEYLEKKAMEWGEPKVPSAKQVMQIIELCLGASVGKFPRNCSKRREDIT